MVEQVEPKSGSNLSSCLQRRHSGPFLATASELLGGNGESWRGSRFWALNDDSDEECDVISSAQKVTLPNKSVKVGSHPEFRPTQGLSALFMAGGVPRRLAARREVVNDTSQGRRIDPPFIQKLSFAEALVSGPKGERKAEMKNMAGNHGGRDREGRGGAGTYGPYHRDRGGVGAGRSWGGRESWARRGGVSRDAYRGAQVGRFGSFGRGRGGQFPPPVGAGKGEWVWREDRRHSQAQGMGNGGGESSEAVDMVLGSDNDPDMIAEDGGSREGGEVVKTGGRCSKCSKRGHLAVACTSEVYCVICDSHDHMNHKCPVLKAPRPVAHAAGYAVMGLGFYHIPHPPLPRLKKESKMAQVSVVGGSLSEEQLILQLKRVVPVKWSWELKKQGDGKFITQFPSKAELQRSIAYGGADVKGEGVHDGIRLQFEEWHEKDEGFLLSKVWVRVRCIREPLREFLILWAVGSLLGSTQTVDMETTRKNEFGRILIAVLDPKLIPRRLDVVIGDHYFDLEFEVEKRGFDENGEEVDVDWDGGEDEGEGKEIDPNSESGLGADQSIVKDNRQSKRDDGGAGRKEEGNNSHSQNGAPTNNSHVLSKAEFQDFLKWKADQVLDVAVDKALDDLATKVAMETEEPLEGASKSLALDAVVSAGNEVGVAEMELEKNIDVVPTEDVEEGSKKIAAVVEPGSSVMGAPNGPATAAFMEATLIPEAVHSPIRASPRLAGVTAEHTLVRAERLVQSKNLECSRGDFQGEFLDQALVSAV
ncbi:hypothetical protein SORBI_3001G028301 [Sorghum bicolor]|uniref:CCHC-type domain-containing protein n=1 Tax=Sorghum bicolor TaxID=4558 RepID=A0A1Z5S447_SORBI|nr:hypothetical protein SORBI_3001G028301 [Sorghum bicolor]